MRCLPIFLMCAFFVVSAFAQETIKNPETPVRPEYKLVFQEDLRFGNPEDDNYLWANDNSMVTSDVAGNIYVTDIANSRVMAYDAEGKFVRVLAEQGEGPGEFRGIPSFQILADGSARATDAQMMGIPRFYRFDKNLAFEKSIVPTNAPIPANAYFSPTGNLFFGISFSIDGANLQLGFAVYGDDYQQRKELSSYPMPMPDFSRMTDPAMWKKQMTHNLRYAFSGIGFVAFDQQGRAYIGDGRKYIITRWDPELTEKELVFGRAYKPVSYRRQDIDFIVEKTVDQILQSPMPQLRDIINESLIRQALDNADVPPVKYPINGLQVTDKGDVLVLFDTDAGTNTEIVDVFSPKGIYLGQVTFENGAFFNPFQNQPRMSFRDGKAYTLEINEEGDTEVVRYRVNREAI